MTLEKEFNAVLYIYQHGYATVKQLSYELNTNVTTIHKWFKQYEKYNIVKAKVIKNDRGMDIKSYTLTDKGVNVAIEILKINNVLNILRGVTQ